MSKKTIWIFNQTAGNSKSGWGERHYFLSKKWKEKGYSVIIFSGSYNHLFTNQPKTKGNFTFEEIEEDIKFCWVKVPKYSGGGYKKFYSNFIYTLRLFFIPTRKIVKPDIIIISSMPIFPVIAANYFKKKLKAKLLITEVRDLWPLTPIYLKEYSKNNLFIKTIFWFEKYAYTKSDFIVSLLPNAKEYISEVSGDRKKFVYIPNGIDEKLIGNESLPQTILDKIPKDKFIIGYTGTIGFANAMEYFIEAAKLILNKNVHFILVGDGILKNTLVKETQNLKNITFIDKIKKSQVQNILKHFDICYIGRYKSELYKYGVSYNKYFDYMLAKKPILESSEYIKDQVELSNCGIIVEPENSKAIINGILKLNKMPKKELLEIGERGKRFVNKFHTYSYLSDKYIELFKKYQ